MLVVISAHTFLIFFEEKKRKKEKKRLKQKEKWEIWRRDTDWPRRR
jgi:hypothetical protein